MRSRKPRLFAVFALPTCRTAFQRHWFSFSEISVNLTHLRGRSRVLGFGQRQGYHRPSGSHGGNPLVVVVGKPALKIRLDLHGAALHVPGSVVLLGTEEEVGTAAERRIGGGNS